VDEIRFHPEAQAEYQAALAWYQTRSPQAAARFEAEAEHVLELIRANPGMFPKYDDEHRFAMLRRFPYSGLSAHLVRISASKFKSGLELRCQLTVWMGCSLDLRSRCTEKRECFSINGL
jgi:plasmid stabilization system protein ParE